MLTMTTLGRPNKSVAMTTRRRTLLLRTLNRTLLQALTPRQDTNLRNVNTDLKETIDDIIAMGVNNVNANTRERVKTVKGRKRLRRVSGGTKEVNRKKKTMKPSVEMTTTLAARMRSLKPSIKVTKPRLTRL
uniref:Uncharacterized protein n=1 Tax=Cacopsylla melanoneura TaxID=428564 RepID=A0A8D9EDJ4_9HEMI